MELGKRHCLKPFFLTLAPLTEPVLWKAAIPPWIIELEETDRKISVSSAVAYSDWNDTRLNIIDTPGFINFIEDTRGCLSVADGAVVIVSAISGVKAETEKIWRYACEFEVPRIVFVNKLDKEAADFSMPSASSKSRSTRKRSPCLYQSALVRASRA